MANKTANILGQEYSFTDSTLTILGVELFSCTAFTATETQAKVNNKGMSNKPISRGRQSKEYSVSMDLSLKDVERIKQLIPGGSLNDMPANIATLIIDNGVDSKTSITLLAFEFGSDGIEFAVDDTEARRTYEGICSDIIFLKL
jgi:hypothetical protein